MELNCHKDCLLGADDRLDRVQVGGSPVHHQWRVQDGRLHPDSLAPLWRPLGPGSLCSSQHRQARDGRQRFHSSVLSHLWAQGSERRSRSLVAGRCS